jgi:hypothetical protein
VCALALWTASCGYALAGRGNALPASISVVGIPYFVNQTSEPEFERVLTDAVRQEFQSKGRYTVEPDEAGAHAVLTATITNVDLRPTAFTEERLPSAYAIVVTANVEFKHVADNNTIIWANPSFRVSEEVQTSQEEGATDVTAFLNQNNARERLARRFARDVVTSIFEAF